MRVILIVLTVFLSACSPKAESNVDGTEQGTRPYNTPAAPGGTQMVYTR
jgi:hypothetical protein